MGGGGGSRLPPISLLISSLLDLMLALVGTRCWCSVAEVLTRLLGRPREAGSWCNCLALCHLFWSSLCPLPFVSPA